MRLEFVPLWDIDEHWSECAPFLAKALERQSAMSLESLHADLKRGKFFLWRIAGRAALITEIQQYPCEKICMVLLCGGEGMEEWVEVADRTLLRHAATLGCQALAIIGRPGWSRMAGYEITDVLMRKRL